MVWGVDEVQSRLQHQRTSGEALVCIRDADGTALDPLSYHGEPKERIMLERYFVKPDTLDRLRASWIGGPIEQYVTWLHEHGYAARNVFRRVPLLWQFGEFARAQGATHWEELPQYVEAFSQVWAQKHGQRCPTEQARRHVERDARNPIQQLLRLILPDYTGRGRTRSPEPFADRVPGFWPYLRQERGLRETTITLYLHSLRRLETYLTRIDLHGLRALSPAVLSAFVTESSQELGKTSMLVLCSHLRMFLGYVHREGLVTRDLRPAVEAPRTYRLAGLPRAISWDEVRQLLEVVDRRTPMGKRDYAILLLLVTYGLRAREVAALTLDDLDWHHDRLRVPERKAGHSTAYPLSPLVGEAWWSTSATGGPPRPSAPYSFKRTPRMRRSPGWRSHNGVHVICAKPGSRCPAPAPTPCGIPVCNAWSIPASISRRSAIMSGMARPDRPRSIPRSMLRRCVSWPWGMGRRSYERPA